jgi:hypothetical protein
MIEGTLLGPYKIGAPIGAGGMGEVFRAVDTRLDRVVAVKVVREQFSARFEREARAIAQLNHPHICTLHDVGPAYLVMELVEGETLAARLKKGALPIDRVFAYGGQIAAALAAAHSKSIVHRDLKPANIMITKTGVKVLDFGLAEIHTDDTHTVSQAVMGTPAYMAPEQLEGATADTRSDIYSLGLVLREMATGKRSAEMKEVPAQFAHVVARCLEPDPADRWQSARDVDAELDWAARTSEIVAPGVGVPRKWGVALATIAIVLATALIWAALSGVRRPAESTPSVRLAITPPAGADFRDGVAISPDGHSVVFAAGAGRLWIRPLNSSAARELPGTEGAAYPFWSPDSREVGFFASGELKRIDVNTGVIATICVVGLGRGGTWNAEGTILFNSVNDGPLLRVPATGGTPAPITALDAAKEENSHRWPYFLPGGRRFLYYIRATADNSGVYVGSLDRSVEKVQLVSGRVSAAVFVPPVHWRPSYLAWVDGGTLKVQAFDTQNIRLTGEAAVVADKVKVNQAGRNAELSVSDNAILIYRRDAITRQVLTWFGRDGRPFAPIGAPDSYLGARISPDGTRVAVTRTTASPNGAIALLELTRGIATPLVGGFWGAWAPDGQRIAFTTAPGGAPNVFTISTSGSGESQRLTKSSDSQNVQDWSADGRFILYLSHSNDISTSQAGSRLWVLSLTGDRTPAPFQQNQFRGGHAQFSPDAQWIVYASNQSSEPEIWVQSFPAGRASWKISSAAGDYPRWRSDGREILYVTPDRTLMAVAVRSTAGTLAFDAPVSLFKISFPNQAMTGGAADYPYDVGADGRRILGFTPAGESTTQTLTVLINWQDELIQGKK